MKLPISLAEISSGRGALPERIGSRKNSTTTTISIMVTILTLLFHLLSLISIRIDFFLFVFYPHVIMLSFLEFKD